MIFGCPLEKIKSTHDEFTQADSNLKKLHTFAHRHQLGNVIHPAGCETNKTLDMCQSLPTSNPFCRLSVHHQFKMPNRLKQTQKMLMSITVNECISRIVWLVFGITTHCTGLQYTQCVQSTKKSMTTNLITSLHAGVSCTFLKAGLQVCFSFLFVC